MRSHHCFQPGLAGYQQLGLPREGGDSSDSARGGAQRTAESLQAERYSLECDWISYESVQYVDVRSEEVEREKTTRVLDRGSRHGDLVTYMAPFSFVLIGHGQAEWLVNRVCVMRSASLPPPSPGHFVRFARVGEPV